MRSHAARLLSDENARPTTVDSRVATVVGADRHRSARGVRPRIGWAMRVAGTARIARLIRQADGAGIVDAAGARLSRSRLPAVAPAVAPACCRARRGTRADVLLARPTAPLVGAGLRKLPQGSPRAYGPRHPARLGSPVHRTNNQTVASANRCGSIDRGRRERLSGVQVHTADQPPHRPARRQDAAVGTQDDRRLSQQQWRHPPRRRGR